MIAATVTCAAAATEAAAQDPSIVLNEQIQLDGVLSDMVLNVVDAQEQVTVANTAQGNVLSGGVVGAAMSVRSDQVMRGQARAETELTFGGDTVGVVHSVTQAQANSVSGAVHDGALDIQAAQAIDSSGVHANTVITGESARLLAGGHVASAATGNSVALGGANAVVTGAVDQTADADVRASTFLGSQYVPAPAEMSAQAVANTVAVTGTGSSFQQMAVTQAATADHVEAAASANAGNGWNLAARAHAVSNQAVFANSGGALVVRTDQDNRMAVRGATVVTAYDFGAATSQARGVANAVEAGSNDVYVKIDNTQVNSGGVDVSAVVSGTNGYDAYVGAEAVGNSVTGYACSTCNGYLEVRNSQTNSGPVTATATATVQGSSRAIVAGAQAVGNAATFYVSRPGG